MARARFETVFAISLATLLVAAAPVFADQIQILRLEGIPGDSTFELHFDSPDNISVTGIDVLSFSWGVTNTSLLTATSGGSTSGAGKAAFTDFNFVMLGGRAIPPLFLKTALGKIIPKA